ncbi:sirohydrochlorin chelatase [Chroococcidiopsis thermalis]|uniref:Cobalamin (Vitamin B12) biosynthesis CbiX protein n=2 Tax=Chroococcidiopsis TaxID=54298 RepID=K9U8L7_CHRTP|nr:sirohydrochlorin chelatase [Chroococcidiopsis thermalis]AFY90594.1 cobalamin (vitamin B12) biosynthesis CbiX protein [Chroococcidiopsis thermalis PCC 7203]
MRSAYLLVSHGSRDPRPQVALKRLAWLLQGSRGEKRAEGAQGAQEAEGATISHKLQVSCLSQERKRASSHAPRTPHSTPLPNNSRLPTPDSRLPLIGTACLELSQKPLHQQIAEFSDRALSCGYQQVQIVPLFLLPGVHVMEDIPAEVEQARQALKVKVKLELRPHLGSHTGLARLLQQQLDRTQAEQTILLAHGSRRKGSEHPVEAIAQQISAVTAYWSVAPSLDARVQELVLAGWRRIAILPYFLFAGGITDAIAEVVGQLQQQFPAIEFCLMQPLGATQELADLIWDAIET